MYTLILWKPLTCLDINLDVTYCSHDQLCASAHTLCALSHLIQNNSDPQSVWKFTLLTHMTNEYLSVCPAGHVKNINIGFFPETIQTFHFDNLHWALQFHTSFGGRIWGVRKVQLKIVHSYPMGVQTLYGCHILGYNFMHKILFVNMVFDFALILCAFPGWIRLWVWQKPKHCLFFLRDYWREILETLHHDKPSLRFTLSYQFCWPCPIFKVARELEKNDECFIFQFWMRVGWAIALLGMCVCSL